MVTKLQHSTARTYDIPAIIAFFGTRQELCNDLKKYDIVDLSVAAISKWHQRGDIPPARRMDLLTLARMKGKRFDISKFVVMAKSPVKKAG